MAILDITPSPLVGKAYKHLLEERMEHGPLGPERAEEVLRQWWAENGPAEGNPAGAGPGTRGTAGVLQTVRPERTTSPSRRKRISVVFL